MLQHRKLCKVFYDVWVLDAEALVCDLVLADTSLDWHCVVRTLCSEKNGGNADLLNAPCKSTTK